MARKTEAQAVHVLVGRHGADQVQRHVGGSEMRTERSTGASANVRGGMFYVLGEAVDVHHGPRLELRSLLPGLDFSLESLVARMLGEIRIRTAKGIEELESRGGQVHDKVVNEPTWPRIEGGWHRVGRRLFLAPLLAPAHQRGVLGGECGVPCLQDTAPDEGAAVFAAGYTVRLDLILACIVHETGVACWVEVVGQDPATLFGSWHSERSDAGHDVRDHLERQELVDEASVLCVKAAVPVHVPKVERKEAARLGHLRRVRRLAG